MTNLINRPLAKRRGDEGFTLIELLVVVVIIGILVAIAVPVYLNYRQGAADKSAQSDVRGAISAVEQYYTDNANAYPAAATGDNSTGTQSSIPLGSSNLKITLSDKTKLNYVPSGTTYKICATNTGGNKYYQYDSTTGGSVKQYTSMSNFTTCTP